ncbi:MAG: HDOD domain-containing protein [Desulfurivibrionaceae bacterium]
MASIESKYTENVKNLVPRPNIALEVLNMAHNLECHFPTLAAKIEKDPNLTANMMRLANSAYFGLNSSFSSIHEILIRLGLETVQILAITGAASGLLSSPQQAYNLKPEDLWYHSYATAILARIICRYSGVEDKNSAYTAALLHDIGKVLLNRPLQIAISDLDSDKKKEFSSEIVLEENLLGTNHARVGRELLKKWRLPENIIEAVGSHHTSPEKHGENGIKMAVFLANYLVGSIGIYSISEEDYPTFNMEELLEREESINYPDELYNNMEEIIDEFFNDLHCTA